MAIHLGVDIGGTFTDVVLLDTGTGKTGSGEMGSGRLATAKVPTSTRDPIGAISAGKKLLLGDSVGADSLSHATTLATNALLEGKLPRGVLLTTRGFRDVLDIGRIQRPAEGIYDFTIDNPPPLIARALRFEVVERMDSRGRVITPLDEAALRATLRGLRGSGIEAIAICYLFAFLNPAHERRTAEIVAEELPGIPVSLSSVVSPEIREFERSSTTVVDALLRPILSPYLAQLDRQMSAEGVAQVRIMMASGGLTASALAAERPVTLVNSGPAAGVLAAANLARQVDVDALITIDMGGTSLDIGVVEQGRTVQKYEGRIAGYPLRVPMIDVAAVAAGGGSIAYVDALGYIQVDRESAGSDPGPACYGRGGERPTITDADLALGRLGSRFEGRGGFTLDLVAARRAIDDHIAGKLGVDTEAAAAGVLRVIQARMAKMISANTLEKGIDIRAMPLFVYGGAGPTHGVELAAATGMRRVLVPYFAGNFSAVGLILSPLRWDAARMVQNTADAVDVGRLDTILGELDREARARLAEAGADAATIRSRWLAHLRYQGQSFDLAVDLGADYSGRLQADTVTALVEAFHALHEKRYAYRSNEETVEIVQLRVIAAAPEIDYPSPRGATATTARSIGSRKVYFTTSDAFRDADLWDRRTLAPGTAIAGPTVIEGEGSSTLVPPGWTATVDSMLNLDIRI